MTLQPTADRDDVLKSAGVLGYEAPIFNTLPSELSTSTTGGASANVDEEGLLLSPGGTAGDTVQLLGASDFWQRRAPGKVTEIGYKLEDTGTPTDDIEIGHTLDTVNSAQGAYWDVTDGQYKAGGGTQDTQPASEPTALASGLIRIVRRWSPIETTFIHYGGDGIAEEVTVENADTASSEPVIVNMKSNGSNDRLYISFVREFAYYDEGT